MPAEFHFHSEALFEYAEATEFYVREASLRVADAFVTAIENALAKVAAAPERWRIIDEPEIRRYVLSKFPFIIYYRWESNTQMVVIYAVMHTSRDPLYWRERKGQPSVPP